MRRSRDWTAGGIPLGNTSSNWQGQGAVAVVSRVPFGLVSRIGRWMIPPRMNDPSEREIVVFNEALQLSPDERAAYLEAACGGDTAMRGRVEALLLANEIGR